MEASLGTFSMMALEQHPMRGMATLLLGTPTTSFCGCSVDGQVPMGREGDVELGGLFHGLEFVCYEVLLSNF